MKNIKSIFIAIAVSCTSISTHALDAPVENKLPITVFYSKQDPHWPAAQKLLDELEKEYANFFKFERTSIDEDSGYVKLTEVESKLNITEPGDMTVVMGAVALISKGEKRNAEQTLPAMLKRMINPAAGKGRVDADLAGYVKGVFGDGAKTSDLPSDLQGLKFFSVTRDNKRVGTVVDVYRPIGCPICNDVQFFLSINHPDLKLLDIKPVRELERYGKKLDDAETTAFLKNFVGGTPETKVVADVITGATKTSNLYERTVNEILEEIKKREKPK